MSVQKSCDNCSKREGINSGYACAICESLSCWTAGNKYRVQENADLRAKLEAAEAEANTLAKALSDRNSKLDQALYKLEAAERRAERAEDKLELLSNEMVYKGNSVCHWHAKALAYGKSTLAMRNLLVKTYGYEQEEINEIISAGASDE